MLLMVMLVRMPLLMIIVIDSDDDDDDDDEACENEAEDDPDGDDDDDDVLLTVNTYRRKRRCSCKDNPRVHTRRKAAPSCIVLQQCSVIEGLSWMLLRLRAPSIRNSTMPIRLLRSWISQSKLKNSTKRG